MSAFGARHLPVALSAVPPATVALIALYHHLLTRYGPHLTLLFTTAVCALMLLVISAALAFTGTGSGAGGDFGLVAQAAVFVLCVFRQAYVTFLASQYWARITSCLRHGNTAVVFGPIFGFTSLLSTVSCSSCAHLGALVFVAVTRHCHRNLAGRWHLRWPRDCHCGRGRGGLPRRGGACGVTSARPSRIHCTFHRRRQ